MATATTKPTDIKPPFDEEEAKLKVKAAEKAWNRCNPELVSQAYTEDSKWRNRTEFITGREDIIDFLRRKSLPMAHFLIGFTCLFYIYRYIGMKIYDKNRNNS
jgi:nuclear transport factor 2 (NTF2) superfamily protein